MTKNRIAALVTYLLGLFIIFACLSGCTSSDITDGGRQSKYGLECYNRPYTDKRDDQSLCITSALSKHHAQVDVHNGDTK